LSACQSKDMRSVGKSQKGSMWNNGETPGDSTATHWQPGLCSRLRGPFGCRSSSSSLARMVSWNVVGGADVKLLFGHLSDRGPRRLPVSATSVRGHRPPGRKSTALSFTLTQKYVLRVAGVFEFFVRRLRPRLSVHGLRFQRGAPQGDPTSDWGGHLTQPVGNRESLRKKMFFSAVSTHSGGCRLCRHAWQEEITDVTATATTP
jgi:hypothetical protein